MLLQLELHILAIFYSYENLSSHICHGLLGMEADSSNQQLPFQSREYHAPLLGCLEFGHLSSPGYSMRSTRSESRALWKRVVLGELVVAYHISRRYYLRIPYDHMWSKKADLVLGQDRQIWPSNHGSVPVSLTILLQWSGSSHSSDQLEAGQYLSEGLAMADSTSHSA